MKHYDYLIIGAGLYGAVFAQQAHAVGTSVLVVDKRPHIAGNVYTEDIEGIHVHKYGTHIFHSNDKRVWDYVNRFAVVNCFTNSPVAISKVEGGQGKLKGIENAFTEDLERISLTSWDWISGYCGIRKW